MCLTALGIGCAGPFLAVVVPRLARVAALVVAASAFGLALAATFYQQPLFALGLITLAIAAAVVASWGGERFIEAVGPLVPGPRPRHTVRDVVLTSAQSRSLDYLLLRTR